MADAVRVLEETSRTFFVPTMSLPEPLREAVMASYLCLRAVDEIEDHLVLSVERRQELLRAVSLLLQGPFTEAQFHDLLGDQGDGLPAVSVRLHEWLMLCPGDIAPQVWEATAVMADRMAYWLGRPITDRQDLDRYCYAVAGAVGLLLSDLWAWHSGVRTDRRNAVNFGRALQTVNILRDQLTDQKHGLWFIPPGWDNADLIRYGVEYLLQADSYVQALPFGPARSFCSTVLEYSWAGIDEATGGEPLTRERAQTINTDCLTNGTLHDHTSITQRVA